MPLSEPGRPPTSSPAASSGTPPAGAEHGAITLVAGDGDGVPLDSWTLPADALPGGARAAVTVSRAEDGTLRCAPVTTPDGSGWVRAAAGDGVSAALVDVLAAGDGMAVGTFTLEPLLPPKAGDPSAVDREVPIVVDQTNESVVVDGASVVKWVRRPVVGDDRAPTLLTHLAQVGFDRIPAPRGFLRWHDHDGAALLALVDTFLPDAVDGWTWCVDALLEHVSAHLVTGAGSCPPDCEARFGAELGRLTGRLHVALATPSPSLPSPVTEVDDRAVAGWRSAAHAALDQVLDCFDDADGRYLRDLAPTMRVAFDLLGGVGSTPVMPIHADYHVGQVLRWPGGLSVIDFDGNPLLPLAERTAPQPAARDVAQMLCSIDHVGRVVNRRTENRHAVEVGEWISEATVDFLGTYLEVLHAAGRSELFDSRLLHPFMVEQECRELRYAAEVLPRWRYAPMAALRSMFATPEETE